jgi:hypothetical protein
MSPYPHPQFGGLRTPVREDMLKSQEITIERKHFLVMLKENPRGRFLRIAEEANGRCNSIMIPAEGLKDFQKLFEELAKAAQENPAWQPPSAKSSPREAAVV